MKNCSLLLLSSAVFCALPGLIGCGASFTPANLQDAAPAVVSGPAISGSVYGGHAPLVGAKVYVVAPSTTANAGLVTSLMNSTSSTTGGYPVTKDTSGGVTNGMYYVTTDSGGIFNLTGDYTCQTNQPVYIVAVGGSPTFPNPTGSVSISGVSEISTSGTGATQTGTLSITASSTELFYPGEGVTLTGFTGDLAYLNNTVQTVLAASLGTTQFEITTSTWNGTKDINASYTALSGKAIATPPQNPAAVNMAALGLCPPQGTFVGYIDFIYMNEISTAAMAYAMSAFGSDAFHIGVDQTGPLNTSGPNGMAGYVTGSMAQALNNAYLLYDVTGGNVSTTYAGEGHIARTQTPGTYGFVPQSLMDTLGNILAACVDSANTSSTTSPACNTLFSNATLDGTTSGTKPTDIAAAAFNIAHHPAGVNNASFISNLFNLPTGNVPFSPSLSTKPNDFIVGIQYQVNTAEGQSNSILNSPQILTVDGQPYSGTELGYPGTNINAIWIGSYGAQVAKLYTFGFPDYTTNSLPAIAGAQTNDARSVAIDNSGNVWIALEKLNELKEFSDAGSLLLQVGPTQFNGTFESVSASLDATGNIFIDQQNNVIKVTSAGVNVPATGGSASSFFGAANSCMAPQSATPFTYTYDNVLDSNGLYYTITTPSSLQSPAYLCVIDPVTGVTKNKVNNYYAYVGNSAIAFMSVDGNQTVWSTDPINNKLLGYNYALHPTATTPTYTYTGGGLNAPASTAIDGAGNIWITNTGNSSLSEFTAAGTALSPTTGYAPLSATTAVNSPNSAGLAIDRAGDVWIAYSAAFNNYTGSTANTNYVIEEIGLAAPTVGPIAYATFHNLNGTKPH